MSLKIKVDALQKNVIPTSDNLTNHQLKFKWLYFFEKAREQLESNNWTQAIINYQHCMHYSAKMMRKSNNHPTVQQQYIMLLLECAYCLRKRDKHFDKTQFLTTTYELLLKHISKTQIDDIIIPLLDVLFSDLKDCEQWIAKLIALDNTKRVVH